MEYRADLPWGDNPGTRYEKKKGANIAGNFPTIDDFRGGIATSYKTINIVENYADAKTLEVKVNEYIEALDQFHGDTWPLGTNHAGVDPSLVKEVGGKQCIVVSPDQIKQKVLALGIPPVSHLGQTNGLKGKKIETTTKDESDDNAMEVTTTSYEAPKEKEVSALQAKCAYLQKLHGTLVKSVMIRIEEVA